MGQIKSTLYVAHNPEKAGRPQQLQFLHHLPRSRRSTRHCFLAVHPQPQFPDSVGSVRVAPCMVNTECHLHAHAPSPPSRTSSADVLTMGDRHCFRASWHDYEFGIYFVTICSRDKEHLFGRIFDNTFYPTPLGSIVEKHIYRIESHYTDVQLVNYVVMPNHIHLVISLVGNPTVGTRLIASAEKNSNNQENPSNLGCLKPSPHDIATPDFHHNSRLSVVIGSFKAGVTREARTRKIASLPWWQPRFHEHIIRNTQAYERIMHYVYTNVENWGSDCLVNKLIPRNFWKNGGGALTLCD